MAKQPVVQTVSTGYYSNTILNDNFTKVASQFDNTISRDGSLPNAMQADLDMGGNDIINVGTITYSITNFSFEKDVYFLGTPYANEYIYRYVSTFNFQIPTNFANSYARVRTPPTLSFQIDIYKDSTAIGNVTFSPSSNAGTYVTTGSSTDLIFSPGEMLLIQAPSFQDVSIADISLSIVGNF